VLWSESSGDADEYRNGDKLQRDAKGDEID
jgi:hypothetical protein